MDIKKITELRAGLRTVRYHFLPLGEEYILSLQKVIDDISPGLMIRVGEDSFFPFDADTTKLTLEVETLSQSGKDASVSIGIMLRKENGLRVGEDEIYQVQDPALMKESQQIFTQLAEVAAVGEASLDKEFKGFGVDAKKQKAQQQYLALIKKKRTQIMDYVYQQNEFDLTDLLERRDAKEITTEEIGKIRLQWLNEIVGLHTAYYRQITDAAAKLTGAKNSSALVGEILRNRVIDPDGKELLRSWTEGSSESLSKAFVDLVYDEFILPECEMWRGVVSVEEREANPESTIDVDAIAEEGKEPQEEENEPDSLGSQSSMTSLSGDVPDTATMSSSDSPQPVSSSGITNNGAAELPQGTTTNK